ncbi:DUF732 domain-containing protein [Mycolicibacterium sp.]|uniref:DUF732 domain-containing protein n=1 Tax=Mycolicibacterium sp. TaxID=2320850 RepID=UPI0037CAEDAE
MNRTVSRLGLLAVSGWLIAAASTVVAPPANATPAEYINALDVNGITYDSPNTAIEFGKLACSKFDRKIPPVNVVAQFVHAGLSDYNASGVVVSAAHYLCPQHVDKLPSPKAQAPAQTGVRA